MNKTANDCGNSHKSHYAEFVKIMNSDKYTDWLYSVSRDGRQMTQVLDGIPDC